MIAMENLDKVENLKVEMNIRKKNLTDSLETEQWNKANREVFILIIMAKTQREYNRTRWWRWAGEKNVAGKKLSAILTTNMHTFIWGFFLFSIIYLCIYFVFLSQIIFENYKELDNFV